MAIFMLWRFSRKVKSECQQKIFCAGTGAEEFFSHMKKILPKLIAALEENKSVLPQKKITAGFDGFVDTIVRIIKEKKPGKDPSFFKTIKQFGNYINDKSGASLVSKLTRSAAASAVICRS